jgi:dephospho-CoA kinase
VRRIALTGGIATGKTHVLDRLRAKGVPCLDADDLAHGVTGPGTEATAAIRARFGDGVIAANGGVDRKALGAVVFADAAARRDLEAIVHPAVRRAIEAGLRGFELLGETPIAVIAIPLLYETGRAEDFDAVVATTCSESQQMERLLARRLTVAEAQLRVRAQLPAAEKAARADFVIDTSGSFEETDRQIEELLGKLRN